jgi:hypothetical protein
MVTIGSNPIIPARGDDAQVVEQMLLALSLFGLMFHLDILMAAGWLPCKLRFKS